MVLSVSDLQEVPVWLTTPGDNTDSSFYSQLAQFARDKFAVRDNTIISGQYVSTGLGIESITVNSEPKSIISICPANIGTGASFCRISTDEIVFIFSYNSVGPVYQLSNVTSPTLTDAKTQNGDGTWTLDFSTVALYNSTTDPDYYAIFIQA